MGVTGLIIISVIVIIFFIIGIIYLNDGNGITNFLGVVGFLGMIIIGGVGFGLYGDEALHYYTVEKVKPLEITRLNYKVYVVCANGQQPLVFSDAENYENINQNTIFYKVTYYNIYKGNPRTYYYIEMPKLTCEKLE